VPRLVIILIALAAIAAVAAGQAAASQLIDRNATNIRLKVSNGGKAMLSYRAHGRHWDVLAWGAINARQPTKVRKQVQFRLDRAGGWGTFGRRLRFRNACGPYQGPPLAHLVTACTAPDGSHWAVQKWRRTLPNLGFAPWRTDQRAWAVHLSHWTGEPAVLEAYMDWSWHGRFHHIFGRLTYLGRPVHGFRTSRYGARLDKYGRVVYLDTFGSSYGPGWRRENSFVTHRGTGVFCYTFRARNPLEGGYAHPPGYRGGMRGPGNGQAYRMTVEGPGVTPDVKWQGKGLPRFNGRDQALAAHELAMNAKLDEFGDRLCRKH
jgi:hypothetical protein